MSFRKWKEGAKWYRRLMRRSGAFLDGLLATTEYCSIRKRQYRNEWLTGLDIRQGRMPRTCSTVLPQELFRDS